jgi:hypothetical protein
MANDTLAWLQEWYLGRCDGDWEHQFGIEIGTLDNPGWRVEIDLSATDLDSATFTPMNVERSEHDWFSCQVADARFRISCGARNLGEALEVFRRWAGEQSFERRKAHRLGG